MLFPKLKTPNKKNFKVDNYIFGQNTVFENGVIKTRNAIKPTGEVLYEKNANHTQSFTLTDAVYFKNNRYNRLCVHYDMLGSFNYRYDFKLISFTGVVTPAGQIEILRTSDAVKKPLSIICFSATSTKGCGIYASINFEHSELGYAYEIYELNSDLNSWVLLTEEDIYIPLYMKNGRGTRYLMSEEKLPDPEYPEELNMLGGICRCSYTTDGVSQNYYLPVESEISNDEHIKVVYYVGGNTEFEFIFQKNTHVSNEVNYMGYNISLAYNNGYIQFQSTPSGFAPEKSPGIDNNLNVYVKHEKQEDYNKKAYMTKAFVMSLAADGEQVVLIGNKKYPSLVLISKPSNPLYFPKNLCLNVGSHSEEVVSAAGVRGKLVLFKQGSVYLVKFNGDKCSTEVLTHNFGCPEPNSVRSVDNAVIFVGNDSKIYAVMSEGSIKEISADINDSIEDFKFVTQVGSLVSSSRYILFADKTAYCLDLKRSDLKQNNFKWNIWNFPPQMLLCDAFEYADRTVFICSTQNDVIKKYYISSFAEERRDEFYAEYEYFDEVSEESIITSINTGLINPDNSFSHKMIERAIFYLNNNGYIETQFLDDKGDIIKNSGINISYRKEGRKPVRVYPLFPSVQFRVKLRSEAPMEFEGIEFEYYNLD